MSPKAHFRKQDLPVIVVYMHISIKSDLKRIERQLTDMAKKQVPFALANALNEVAFSARESSQQQMKDELDNPTPFTVSGVRVKKASKRKPQAEVYITQQVWDYLKWQVKGGRKGSNNRVPLPSVRLNKYGNIPGKRKGLIKNRHQFIAKRGDVVGLWERGTLSSKGKFSRSSKKKSSSVRLLVYFADSASYQKRFKFREGVMKVVRREFSGAFRRQLDKAMKSAR